MRQERDNRWYQFSLFSMLLIPMLIASFYLGWKSHRDHIRASYLKVVQELKSQHELEALRRAQESDRKRMEAMSQMYRDEQLKLENRVRSELRQPAVSPLQRTSLHRVELPMTPERSIFQAGDRVDILGKDAEGSKYIALDTVVLGASSSSLWLGLRPEDRWLVMQKLQDQPAWTLQRTISLELLSGDDAGNVSPITNSRK
jgi:hypothetical protein